MMITASAHQKILEKHIGGLQQLLDDESLFSGKRISSHIQTRNQLKLRHRANCKVSEGHVYSLPNCHCLIIITFLSFISFFFPTHTRS